MHTPEQFSTTVLALEHSVLQQQKQRGQKAVTCLKSNSTLQRFDNKPQIFPCEKAGPLQKWNFLNYDRLKTRTSSRFKVKLLRFCLDTFAQKSGSDRHVVICCSEGGAAKNQAPSAVFPRGERLQYDAWSSGCLSVCCNVV